MEALFGRYEAAVLLAVERANGGELAPLEQVISSYEGLFGSSVTAQTFTESTSLLIDAGLVDWADRGLELTLAGRKLIRRSGTHWDAELPDKVTARLADLGEADLAEENTLAQPSEAEVAAAMEALGIGRLEGHAPLPGETFAPSSMAGHQTTSARLLAGLDPSIGVVVGPVGSRPLVEPDEEEEEES